MRGWGGQTRKQNWTQRCTRAAVGLPKPFFCTVAPPVVTDPLLGWAVFLSGQPTQPFAAGQCVWDHEANVGGSCHLQVTAEPSAGWDFPGLGLGDTHTQCRWANRFQPSSGHRLGPGRKQNQQLVSGESLSSRARGKPGSVGRAET